MPKFEVSCIYKFRKSFTERDDGEDAKKRYFLYLGNTSEFLSNPITVYVATSTTQLKQFGPSGEKANTNFLRFSAGSYGFTDDCVICFDEIKTYMTEPMFESYEPEEKGRINDKEVLSKIYGLILQSKRISKIVKYDIHSCFNKIITGLKMPK